jgi:hypothetical protein
MRAMASAGAGGGILRCSAVLSTMTVLKASNQFVKLRGLVALAAIVLFLKVLLAILAEYRWYFPADFEHSAFLSGKRSAFVGSYVAAFYVHIISGPSVVALGLFLVLSGGRPQLRHWHCLAGRLLVLLVLVGVVPSGLVLARQAYAGPVAAAGFAALSVATGACAIALAYFARTKDFRSHQRFAIPCFILLSSPLLLRLASGVAIVMDCESELFYQLNAWLSWLVPLAIYEFGSRWIALGSASRSRPHRNPITGITR